MNGSGQLGTGTTFIGVEKKPVMAVELKFPVVSSSCGDFHTLLLTSGGDVYACGLAEDGRLGLGPTVHTSVARPAYVKFPVGVAIEAISAGASHSAAVCRDGVLYVWGDGRGGALGLGVKRVVESPEAVAGFCTKVRDVRCGDGHTLVLLRDGTVMSSGMGVQGQLGTGTLGSSTRFSVVAGALTGKIVVQIACGSYSSAAITDLGELYTWGMGMNGRLGLESEVSHSSPVLVACLKDRLVTRIALGSSHGIAITEAVAEAQGLEDGGGGDDDGAASMAGTDFTHGDDNDNDGAASRPDSRVMVSAPAPNAALLLDHRSVSSLSSRAAAKAAAHLQDAVRQVGITQAGGLVVSGRARAAQRVFHLVLVASEREFADEKRALAKSAFRRLRDLCDARGVTFSVIDLRAGGAASESATLAANLLRIELDLLEAARAPAGSKIRALAIVGDDYGASSEDLDPRRVSAEAEAAIGAAEPHHKWLQHYTDRSALELALSAMMRSTRLSTTFPEHEGKASAAVMICNVAARQARDKAELEAWMVLKDKRDLALGKRDKEEREAREAAEKAAGKGKGAKEAQQALLAAQQPPAPAGGEPAVPELPPRPEPRPPVVAHNNKTRQLKRRIAKAPKPLTSRGFDSTPELDERVGDLLVAELERSFPEPLSARVWDAQRAAWHLAALDAHARSLCGRGHLLSELDQLIELQHQHQQQNQHPHHHHHHHHHHHQQQQQHLQPQAGARLIAVSGEAGSGKSAVVCAWAKRLSHEGTSAATVLYHDLTNYAGACREDDVASCLLAQVRAMMGTVNPVDDNTLSAEEARHELSAALAGLASVARGLVVVVLDGLDLLVSERSASSVAEALLPWLPSEDCFPRNLYVVGTLRPGPVLTGVALSPRWISWRLRRLNDAEAMWTLRAASHLAVPGAEASAQSQDILAKAAQRGCPLYLSALAFVDTFAFAPKLPTRARPAVKDSLAALYGEAVRLVGSLEYPGVQAAALLPRLFAWCAVSQLGLSLSELALLSQHPEAAILALVEAATPLLFREISDGLVKLAPHFAEHCRANRPDWAAETESARQDLLSLFTGPHVSEWAVRAVHEVSVILAERRHWGPLVDFLCTPARFLTHAAMLTDQARVWASLRDRVNYADALARLLNLSSGPEQQATVAAAMAALALRNRADKRALPAASPGILALLQRMPKGSLQAAVLQAALAKVVLTVPQPEIPLALAGLANNGLALLSQSSSTRASLPYATASDHTLVIADAIALARALAASDPEGGMAGDLDAAREAVDTALLMLKARQLAEAGGSEWGACARAELLLLRARCLVEQEKRLKGTRSAPLFGRSSNNLQQQQQQPMDIAKRLATRAGGERPPAVSEARVAEEEASALLGEALTAAQEALAIRRRVLGPAHPLSGLALVEEGLVHFAAKRFREALLRCEKGAALLRADPRLTERIKEVNLISASCRFFLSGHDDE
jgi:alpha-tubulin suppressor-like RCC1 family protein